ncbi:ABC transporter substrate-binding protein [Bordetella sp. FB-8]|uniref:ABC transporter substrate-binding protein n=1 Tax=Bordetella sp. FB-8 TaxID=1159870 RepID=UPI00037C35AE|nr:ABC transporter substrate-binding protein [Bordetella sp. FB-8]
MTSNFTVKRRDILKMMGVGAVASTASGLLVLGDISSAQAAPMPKRGGKLRAASANSSVSDTLDPAKGSNSGDYIRQFMFYSGLTELSAKMRAEPALAESFDSPDGITWTFRLRKGVTFHDGKALTAQDVVFSLARHKLPETGSQAKVLADQFAQINAVDAHTVQIVLVAPNVDLPSILGTSPFLIVQDGTKDFSKGIGTGPFKCKSFTPARSTVGVRNPNFWKPGKPYLDEVELLGLTDASARLNGLLAGDLQLVASVQPSDAVRLKQSKKHAILETKSGMYTDLIVRVDQAPGNNADFVDAMRYLQPREQIVKTALHGYGTVANDHPVPPWHPYYAANLPQRPYDLERAKFHVKKGKLQGLGGDLVCSEPIDGSVEGAQLLQQAGNQVGLKLNVRRVPYDGYWSQHWMKHPMSYGSINPRPTLDMLFSQFYYSSARWNESGWKNAQFDQLLVASRGETDDAKRKKMYGDMQVLIAEHCGTIVPAFISFLDGYDRRVKGLESNPMGMLMGYRFAEFVWLEA